MSDIFKFFTWILDTISTLFTDKHYYIFSLKDFISLFKQYYDKFKIFIFDIGYYVERIFLDATYRLVFLLIIFILFNFFKKNINNFLQKIFKKPKFIDIVHKKAEFQFHAIRNVYVYGMATHERKYDREAFAVEEQIFQQCVSPRALTNLQNVEYYNRRY
jgi:hypothetical protein